MIGYIQDDAGDLMVENGDFVLGDVKPDMVADILNYMPGDNKAAPELGAGLRLSMGGKPDAFLSSRLKSQSQSQGIEIRNVLINGSDVAIEL